MQYKANHPLKKTQLKLWTWLAVLSIFTGLACATNTPVAQRVSVRPTRTPLPTFTPTSLPPTDTATPLVTDTPTPTDTPTATNTPVSTVIPLPPTPTLAPTATPVPPTNTPRPAPPPPPPPTNTPQPTPTPVPAPVSPLGPPTNTPIPASPPGKYRPKTVESQNNCAHLGVTGIVRDGDEDDDAPMTGVTIMVTGDEDGFRGPYYITTGSDGKYGMVIAEFGKVPTRVEFEADIFGPGVDTDDRPQWSFSNDCHDDNGTQVLRVDWAKVE